MKIELNLEESGVLCHLLMEKLCPFILSNRVKHDPYTSRMLALYERLAAINDQLMGKK